MSTAYLILNLTNAAGQGLSAYYEAAARLTFSEVAAVMSSYETEMDKINALFEKNLDTSLNIIDPMMLTDATNALIESSEAFLQRTLMTGSDVADMSFALVDNFASITLSTELDT